MSLDKRIFIAEGGYQTLSPFQNNVAAGGYNSSTSYPNGYGSTNAELNANLTGNVIWTTTCQVSDVYNFGNNGNINFNRNGSMNNSHNVEKTMQKFLQLAKDAQSNGDPVLAQNYLQHADHYLRRYNELIDRKESSTEKTKVSDDALIDQDNSNKDFQQTSN